ncbi:hypothetical protein [Glycomyces buryatensis]|uniref:Uncharacterized protein n=1 Tax=Glycomyces buryatensis TaxID=2570927 RepID=A0A4S8PRN0_9ACTN|nr:hypothetical protein [Glycomyces buryatensis]THV33923.1 hypothetical protein FAB82_24410 [Glycomyces buryatensis]
MLFGGGEVDRARPSVDAELVAFGVAHDVGRGAAVGGGVVVLGAEGDQPIDLCELLVLLDVEVDMAPVLGGLALREVALSHNQKLGTIGTNQPPR